MDLEIMNWDVEGAAYKNGAVVDGAYLVAHVRRRAEVDGQGNVVSPAGDPFEIKVPLSGVSSTNRATLFGAFGAVEAIVKTVATDHVTAQGADPKALDAKIQAADVALKQRAEAEQAKAELDAAADAKRAELAALDEQIAAKKAAAADAIVEAKP
jgi:hypothetical protein